MILESLHRYAESKGLMSRLPFQDRTVHWLVPLNADGSLAGEGLIELTTPAAGTKGRGGGKDANKETPGRTRRLPRFPGDNNGGRAHYLADRFSTVFGVRQDAAEWLPATARTRTDRNPVCARDEFWRRIAEAADRTQDVRLNALLAFRDRYLLAAETAAATAGPNSLGWLDWRPSESSRSRAGEWLGRTADGRWRPFRGAETVAFAVEGGPLWVGPPYRVSEANADVHARTEIGAVGGWSDDAIWRDWQVQFLIEFFREGPASAGPRKTKTTVKPRGRGRDADRDRETCADPYPDGIGPCLATGRTGERIARSHKPKILGVAGLKVGGYLVSFAESSPAFSSYGLKMGENAPVSERGAAAYALAINDLMADPKASRRVGRVSYCVWDDALTPMETQTETRTEEGPGAEARNAKGPAPAVELRPSDETTNSASACELARRLWDGDATGLASEGPVGPGRFCALALSANSGRVVVRDWRRVPRSVAAANVRRWFDDLAVAGSGTKTRVGIGTRAKRPVPVRGPLSLTRLAAAAWPKTAGESAEGGRVAARDRFALELWAKAIDGDAPNLGFLRPVLDATSAALASAGSPAATRIDPGSDPSRLALLKWVLLRNLQPDGPAEFRPRPQLDPDSTDVAYTLGRLLALCAQARRRARGGSPLESLGPVERRFAAVLRAPATEFPELIESLRRDVKRIERNRRNEGGAKGAASLRARADDLLGRLPMDRGPGEATFRDQDQMRGESRNEPEWRWRWPRTLDAKQQAAFALGFGQQRARDRAALFVRVLLRKAKDSRERGDAAASESFALAAWRKAEESGDAGLRRQVRRVGRMNDGAIDETGANAVGRKGSLSRATPTSTSTPTPISASTAARSGE